MSSNSYITKAFHVSSARQFTESFSEPANSMYYLTIGKHLPFANDSAPPKDQESGGSLQLGYHDSMVYGKNITPTDISLVTLRRDWAANTVYAKYTDSVANLYETNFFIVRKNGTSYDVFKCLDNNGGQPSIVAPSRLETSADDDFYFTSDGYQWKWMYSFDETTYAKFSTTNFIPVVPNANITSNAISGSIDVIEVVTPGSNYNSYNSGTIQESAVGGNVSIFTISPTAASNNDFYSASAIKIINGPGAGEIRKISDYFVAGATKRIVIDTPFNTTPTTNSSYEITPLVTVIGDGNGATARAVINSVSNSISRIEVVDRGSGYTWASVVITGNTGVISSNTLVQPNAANARPIMGPFNGHGYDPGLELGANFVVLSVNFDATQSDNRVVNQNDFRNASILQDPLFANVVINISGTVGTGFSIGETITQGDTNTTGKVVTANTTVIKATNVKGKFQSGNSSYGIITGAVTNTAAQVASVSGPIPYFDNTVKLTVDMEGVLPFQLDEKVVQGENANGYVYSVSQVGNTATYIVRLTNVRGVFNLTDDALDLTQLASGVSSGQSGSVTDIQYGDLVKGTGTVLYTENFSPVAKANTQTETIKVVLEF